MAKFLIAKHLNGSKVYLDISNREVTLDIPAPILYSDQLNCLENGSNVAITESRFFNNYVGVATTVSKARSKLDEVLVRVFSRFLEENTFFDYLEKELHFDMEHFIPTIKTGSSYIVTFKKS